MPCTNDKAHMTRGCVVLPDQIQTGCCFVSQHRDSVCTKAVQ